MTIALGSLLIAAFAALALAPAAAMTTLGVVAAGLGLWLHATLPPPAEETTEALLLTAFAAM